GCELSRMVARHGETSDKPVIANHGYGQDGPDARFNKVVPQATLVGARDGDIGHLNGLQRDGGPPEYSFALPEPRGAAYFGERAAGLRNDPLAELFSGFVVFENHTAVESR